MSNEPARSHRHQDVNAAVGGYLRDLAMAQTIQATMFGYKRAAAAIFRLEQPLTDLRDATGARPRIVGIGPGSTRVIDEVLAMGSSPTVERTIDESGRREDIERRRVLRRHFLSRAEVLSDSWRSDVRWTDVAGISRRFSDALRVE